MDARSGDPVPYALVRAGSRRVVADLEGRFRLSLPSPGSCTLTVRQVGYRPLSLRLFLEEDTFLLLRLVPRLFTVGPVEVRARAPGPEEKGLSEQVWTAAELLHLQANNLADVLEYLPWVELPGMRRTGPEEARRFYLGSMPDGGDPLILRDGQIESGRTSMGFSPDNFHLRDLPLEEIAEVRVLRGVLPAAYGYTSSGVVEIRTREEGPGQVQFKQFGFPSGAWTLSLEKGWCVGRIRGRLYLDFLQTQGERVERTESRYRRVTPTLRWSVPLGEKSRWTGTLRYQRVLYGAPDPMWFHDNSWGIQGRSRWTLGSLTLEMNGTLKAKDFYRRRDLGYDPQGRWRGWGELQVLGREWWGTLRVRWRETRSIGSFSHTWDLGATLQREGNMGRGVTKTTWYEEPRPKVPFGFSRWGGALFLEDQVRGLWKGVPFRLRGGLRLEAWTEGGAALSPRLKLAFFPHRRLGLTFGIGHSFGPPTLAQLHALPRKPWQVGLTDNPGLRGQGRWTGEMELAFFFPFGSLRISLGRETMEDGITTRTIPLAPQEDPDSVVVIYTNDLRYTTRNLGVRFTTRTIGHLDLTLSGYFYETRYHRVRPTWDPQKGWIWSPRDARRQSGQLLAHLRYFDPALNLWISLLLKAQAGIRVSWEGETSSRPFRGYGDLKVTKAVGPRVLLALAVDNFLDHRWSTYNEGQGWVEEFHPLQLTLSIRVRIR